MTTWLTAKEAAAYAKVSLWTVRQAVTNGDLQAYAVGGGGRSYRLKAADVDAWMESTPHEPGRSA